MTAQKKAKAGNHPTIDPEFSAIIPPLSSSEQAGHEKNLRAEGCRDRLVVWKGKNILLDGHHRLDICKKHDLPYDVVEIELADREAAYYWIIANQLFRRNLTPEAVSYLRGKRYNAEKKSHGGDRRSEQSSGNGYHLKTDEALASEYKIAPKTIRNNGDFASDLDKITENVGDKLKTALLRGEIKTPQRKMLHDLAEKPASDQEAVVTGWLESGTMPSLSAEDGNTSPNRRALEKILVPVDPIGLARALLHRKGAAYAEEVQQAISTVVAEHRAKQEKTQNRKESEQGTRKRKS